MIGAAIMPATAPIMRGKAPAQRQHPADADADEPARHRVLCRRAHGEPERREAEEQEHKEKDASVTTIMPTSCGDM